MFSSNLKLFILSLVTLASFFFTTITLITKPPFPRIEYFFLSLIFLSAFFFFYSAIKIFKRIRFFQKLTGLSFFDVLNFLEEKDSEEEEKKGKKIKTEKERRKKEIFEKAWNSL